MNGPVCGRRFKASLKTGRMRAPLGREAVRAQSVLVRVSVTSACRLGPRSAFVSRGSKKTDRNCQIKIKGTIENFPQLNHLGTKNVTMLLRTH